MSPTRARVGRNAGYLMLSPYQYIAYQLCLITITELIHVKLPGVHSVDLQLALVNECMKMKRIHTLVLE